MGRFKVFCGSSTCHYVLFGIAFGTCFPVAAILFDVLIQFHMPLAWSSAVTVHTEDPVLYMIDSAPFFLGVSFGIAGYYLQKSKNLIHSLSLQAENLENSNLRLQKALEDFQSAQKLLIRSEKLSSLGE